MTTPPNLEALAIAAGGKYLINSGEQLIAMGAPELFEFWRLIVADIEGRADVLRIMDGSKS